MLLRFINNLLGSGVLKSWFLNTVLRRVYYDNNMYPILSETQHQLVTDTNLNMHNKGCRAAVLFI